MLAAALFLAAAPSSRALQLSREPDSLAHIAPGDLSSFLRADGLLFLALVNPSLPASEQLHGVLHTLTAHYAAHPSIGIAYTDVSVYPDTMARYGVRELPTLLVFLPHVPPRSPYGMAFAPHRSALSYIHEIDELWTAAAGIGSLPAYLGKALAQELQTLAREEAEEVRRANVTSTAAVAITTPHNDGDAAQLTVDTNATAGARANRVHALAAALVAEEEHLRRVLDIQTEKLRFLRSTLRDMEAASVRPLQRRYTNASRHYLHTGEHTEPAMRQTLLMEMTAAHTWLQAIVEH